ncbi:GDSL-type esterase/lipase family protein [Subtercola sp. Z020]|uniref:SGNH/GDSL hydrolase family protein n=1 Tax=Subtercola sp. Z020 TaxID=2080582 RepID=UPI00130E18FD|nr:GDSL-type esterase/lipase family protein [Subtercola sp. Z020]
MAVVGDSNSTGHLGDIDTGIAAKTAWIAQVGTDDIEYAGGWARDGATSALMASQVQPVPDADVVVIMAGTNDLAAGLTLEQLDDDITSIVSTVGAKNVVLAAIPPITLRADYAVEANADLEALAAKNGWFFHDGWGNLRTADGVWSTQYKVDGIHTTKAGYGVFGRDMGEFIRQTFLEE